MKMGIPICLLACTAVLLGSTALAAQETITLQQGLNGYTGTADSWLDESLTRDNYGGSSLLRIQWYNGRNDVAVVRFELSGQIPPGARILWGTLWLWYVQAGSFQNDNAMTIKPFRLTASWDENVYDGQSGTGVSYRYRDINELYEWTGGAEGGWWDKADDGNGTNRIKKTGGTPPAIEPQNWVSFDVTPTVTQWHGGAANYGFLVVATGFEGGGTTVYGLFSSRQEGLASYRPKLVICYERTVAVEERTWSAIKAQYR